MASAVTICNLALSHIGDTASVSSIDPPEGSAQAEHCSRFYPIAVDSLLEMHYWNFTMRRVVLAALTSEWPEWLYAYAVPSDANNIISILPSDAADDYSTKFSPTDTPNFAHNYSPMIAAGRYSPQPYTLETLSNGTQVLYTNQENAVLRYTAHITDPTQFSPLFVMTLSYHLASMLAGPIIKGETGAAEAKRLSQMMAVYLQRATASDSNQRNSKPDIVTPWISGR
jgi:hypothetical protein